jgi:hypothetical protein
MTANLHSLVHSKVALAVLGVLLAGGSGAAVVAASHNQNPASSSSATAPDAHRVSINGKLTAYDAGAKTISVQPADASGPTTIGVDANTRVNGQHAKSLADLSTAIGHDVQVHADKQSNGTLLAWKITVQGDDSSHGTGSGNGKGKGKGKGNGQQHQIAGTIASVGTDSMTSSSRRNGYT